jgi:homoserine O-acetyltransferase
MKTSIRHALCLFTLSVGLTNLAGSQTLQFAELGDFKLEDGEVIRNCRIGYRTLGTLNADRSNIILFPTWALGTTEQLISNVGTGRLVDSSKYYVILVDALGNGVSSSPSNSKLQSRMRFPRFTIHDMVNTQHELLTNVLQIHHVKAVLGISMGGMQTFQWMVSYPDFMDKAIPLMGSPCASPYDIVSWRAQIRAITSDPDWRGGNYTNNPARVAEAEFLALILTTPDEFNRHHTREQVAAELDRAKNTTGFDSNDKIRQLQALMALDVTAPFDGSMERAADVVKARVFVIVATKDRAVVPQPALHFAHLLHAKTLELDSDCGHTSNGCEARLVNSAVAEFLEQ